MTPAIAYAAVNHVRPGTDTTMVPQEMLFRGGSHPLVKAEYLWLSVSLKECEGDVACSTCGNKIMHTVHLICNPTQTLTALSEVDVE